MYENQPIISLIVGAVTPRPAAPSGRPAAGWRPAAPSICGIADLQPCAPYYHFSTKLYAFKA